MDHSFINARLLILLTSTALLTLAGVWSNWSAHGEQTQGADRGPVENHFTWRKASSTKRSLGGRVLLLDIRRGVSDSDAAIFDAHVPFVEHEAEEIGRMTFRSGFTTQVDEALRAAHLKHSSPVILVCDDHRCGELAAALLHEHGYERLYVVSDPEAALHARRT